MHEGNVVLKLTIALAQINPLVGAIQANVDKIIQYSKKARDQLHADAVVFPELTVTAYPPEDLLLRRDFVEQTQQAINLLSERIPDIHIIVGFPEFDDGDLYNSAAILFGGGIKAIYRKNKLPNYGVFDEKRYFKAGQQCCVVDIQSVPVGISICEDSWAPGVVENCRDQGAQLMLNLNASPFHAGKIHQREQVLKERIQASGIPMVYVNQVGGQDELVFDGASFVIDATGTVVFRADEFIEQLAGLEFDCSENHCRPIPQTLAPPYNRVSSEYKALVLGIRDYVSKNGFKGCVLGLSGGIDSALTLALAVDALGPDQVEAVLMPSQYTQDISIIDAVAEAEALGVKHHTITIEPAVSAFSALLEELFIDSPKDTTEENIQARCRGVILMAISNKQGRLLLTTGNKSEMSVGYATLYGDMAGGFAPLKDVPKLLVYAISQYRNSISPVIPERVIIRPPSAELAPDQIDEDSLPPYSELDLILELYVEQDLSADEIIDQGFETEHVHRAISLVDRNEYKRRQSPPGIRITERAFGRDRRYPITSGYRGVK